MNSARSSLTHFQWDRPKPAPSPGEADLTALYNLLLAGKATREESRTVVRLLLRQAASRKLERIR